MMRHIYPILIAFAIAGVGLAIDKLVPGVWPHYVSWSLLIVSALLVIYAICGLLLEPKREVTLTKDKADGPVTITGSDNIISVGQSGGVTARTYVNNAPNPELKIESDNDTSNPDGTHTRVVRLRVVSPYAPGQLLLRAEAIGITSGDIHPVDTGQIHFGQELTSDAFSVEVSSPVGRYDLVVNTPQRRPLNIRYAFR
jgi:hypothetical protein